LLATPESAAEAVRVLESARSGLGEAAPKISRCADAQGAAHRKYKF